MQTKNYSTRLDFFWFSETSHRTWEEQVALPAKTLVVYVDEIPSTVEELIALGRANGMPKGSARSGCFEIQTPDGCWLRKDRRGFGRLTDANAELVDWDSHFDDHDERWCVQS